MKFAVCVKEVPAATGTRRIDPSTGRLVREGDQVLNPFDAHAVEAALQLREAGGDAADATVVAVSMAPAAATRTLQKALALGADEAVLLADERLAGSDMLSTARVLAAELRSQGADLVLLGQQGADSDGWLMPAIVAELLGWPVLTQAGSLLVEGGRVTVERQTETGYERLEAELPAVVSVSDAVNEPRYPSLKSIMGAKRKPLTTKSLDDLGLDASVVGSAGSGTTVLGQSAPPAKQGGVKIEDDGTAADQIVAFLAEKHLV